MKQNGSDIFGIFWAAYVALNTVGPTVPGSFTVPENVLWKR